MAVESTLQSTSKELSFFGTVLPHIGIASQADQGRTKSTGHFTKRFHLANEHVELTNRILQTVDVERHPF